jgi:hypothetical protein
MAKTHLMSAALGAAVLAAAVFLNPSPDRHREKIRASVAQRSPLAGALGVGALAAFVSTYHSLGVASYTTVKDKTLSIGVLGMVFVLEPAVGK